MGAVYVSSVSFSHSEIRLSRRNFTVEGSLPSRKYTVTSALILGLEEDPGTNRDTVPFTEPDLVTTPSLTKALMSISKSIFSLVR